MYHHMLSNSSGMYSFNNLHKLSVDACGKPVQSQVNMHRKPQAVTIRLMTFHYPYTGV